jgi:myxalamid-type polyketide synthase MxaE and MxaD
LHGIFHAATVVNPTKLFDLTEETVDGMLRPKVSGTWMLHELTKDLDLDFFLVFSSAASLLGTQGLAHYAAANQFQDSLAHYRHGLGLPMLSINWGAWETVRLVGPDEQSRFAKAGWLTMPSQKLFNMFPALIASSRAQVMIGNMDWDILKQVFEAQRARPLLEGFDAGHAGPNRASAVFTPLATHLRRESAMTPEERHQSMETFVREQAAQVLGFRRGELPPVNVPLMDLGLDSLMAVDLKNRLRAGLGQELSPTVVFDHPSIDALVGLLETMLWAADSSLESELATTGRDEIRI